MQSTIDDDLEIIHTIEPEAEAPIVITFKRPPLFDRRNRKKTSNRENIQILEVDDDDIQCISVIKPNRLNSINEPIIILDDENNESNK